MLQQVRVAQHANSRPDLVKFACAQTEEQGEGDAAEDRLRRNARPDHQLAPRITRVRVPLPDLIRFEDEVCWYYVKDDH